MKSIAVNGFSENRSNKWTVGTVFAAIATSTVGLLLFLPMLAVAADDPAAAQYNDQTPNSEVLGGGGDPSGTIGSLPFTGTDILLLAVAAIVLFAVAATLRRFAQRRQSAN